MLSYTIVLINTLYSLITGEETVLISIFAGQADKLEHFFASIVNAITGFWFINR